MILDDLNNYEKYVSLHPAFPDAFIFLKNLNFNLFTSGKRQIDGERLFVIGSISAGKGKDNVKLEVHRKFIDIQCTVNAVDYIGWKPLSKCTQLDSEYDSKTDLQFFSDEPDSWFSLVPGTFVIFYPDDAHAPLAVDVEDRLHKIVVKVQVN
jgi:YhcH/YjgK/YiaL family protein